MAAVMKYYIAPFFTKSNLDRGFWINIYKCLYFSYTTQETDANLARMMIYAFSEAGSIPSM